MIDPAGPRPDQIFLRHTPGQLRVAALATRSPAWRTGRHPGPAPAELLANERPAVLGVLDLDRVKDVNTCTAA